MDKSIWHRSRPFVVGHRGGRGEGWPRENSMAAFERARDEGAVAIETDVRLTRAGEVVLWHDREIGGQRVADLDVADVDALRLTRLGETLAWARRCNMGVNVEIKNDPRPFALVRAVARIVRRAEADVLVSSFDRALVGAFLGLCPTVPVAWLTHAGQNHALNRVTRFRAPFFALHPERSQADAAEFALWKERGYRLGIYTVNDPEEATRLVAIGADWIVTDCPAKIRVG